MIRVVRIRTLIIVNIHTINIPELVLFHRVVFSDVDDLVWFIYVRDVDTVWSSVATVASCIPCGAHVLWCSRRVVRVPLLVKCTASCVRVLEFFEVCVVIGWS